MDRPGIHQYSYESAGFTNPGVQRGYDEDVLGIVRALPGLNSVCDLGCGNGRLSERLAQGGLACTGIDSSKSGVDIAKGQVGAKARYVCAPIDESLVSHADIRGTSFDAVVSIDVIEHMFLPRDLLRAAHGLLRSGGVLILGTPYHGYLKNLAISLVAGWDAHHSPGWDGGHVKFFSVRTLGELVREAGFADLKFHYSGRAPLLWRNMVCVARKP